MLGDHVFGELQGEGGRRTTHIHIESKAVDAKRFLHFDGDGRVGALKIGATDDHRVDIGGFALSGSHRVTCGGDGHLGQDGQFLVRPLGNARAHDVGIEHALLVHDVAALDAGRLDDEVDRKFLQRRDRARGNRGLVRCVVAAHEFIKGGDEFLIGNRLRRRKESRSRNR